MCTSVFLQYDNMLLLYYDALLLYDDVLLLYDDQLLLNDEVLLLFDQIPTGARVNYGGLTFHTLRPLFCRGGHNSSLDAFQRP